MINIVGLGPGDHKYLTLEARIVIEDSKRFFARTREHSTVKFFSELGFDITSFDQVYEKSGTFDEVYETIVEEIIKESKKGDLTYMVPGSPVVFEKTVTMLIERLQKDKYRLVHGVSFLDILLTKLKIDPLSGLSVVDAMSLEEEATERRGAIVITQCYDRFVASEVKLWLGNIIDDEAEIFVCHSLGNSENERIESIKVYELDHSDDFSHETTVVAFS